MFKFWNKNKKNIDDNSDIEKILESDIDEAPEDTEKNSTDCEEDNIGLELESTNEAGVDNSIADKDFMEDVIENILEEGDESETIDSIPESENMDYTSESENINPETEIEDSEKVSKGLFSRLLEGLTKTKNNITVKIDRILGSYAKIDEDMLEEIEEILITADVGMNTTMEIVDKLRDLIKERCIKDPKEVKNLLKEVIEGILNEGNSTLDIEPSPAIIVMVGVNGVGKTTTIGKLAQRYKEEGKKVILGAGDTFRAAASEQLEIWANRVGVDIVKHSEGADPGAVVFDAIKATKARNGDLLIVDTAGRLHNKANLMKELGKIFKIIDREFPEAKLEVLLVVDATTGQNAVSQAKTFKEVCNITGIVLTKLDGTAKGGVVLAVKSEVDVPVKLIGVGETVADLQDFNPKSFTEALFG